MSVQPFTISVPNEKLEDLSKRLSLATFPEQLDGDNLWDFGTPTAEVKKLVEYWKNGFDWRKAEAQLNKLPNFRTSIDAGQTLQLSTLSHRLCPTSASRAVSTNKALASCNTRKHSTS